MSEKLSFFCLIIYVCLYEITINMQDSTKTINNVTTKSSADALTNNTYRQ